MSVGSAPVPHRGFPTIVRTCTHPVGGRPEPFTSSQTARTSPLNPPEDTVYIGLGTLLLIIILILLFA